MNGLNRKLLRKFARESNAIEGITSKHAEEVHVAALNEFLRLETLTIRDLCWFVDQVQPGARLRVAPLMDVRVGDHHPPSGGKHILPMTEGLLERALGPLFSPFEVHREYETLHPFMDGNGRSGRALWAWMMLHHNVRPGLELGFLHAWYYQSLEAVR